MCKETQLTKNQVHGLLGFWRSLLQLGAIFEQGPMSQSELIHLCYTRRFLVMLAAHEAYEWLRWAACGSLFA